MGKVGEREGGKGEQECVTGRLAGLLGVCLSWRRMGTAHLDHPPAPALPPLPAPCPCLCPAFSCPTPQTFAPLHPPLQA